MDMYVELLQIMPAFQSGYTKLHYHLARSESSSSLHPTNIWHYLFHFSFLRFPRFAYKQQKKSKVSKLAAVAVSVLVLGETELVLLGAVQSGLRSILGPKGCNVACSTQGLHEGFCSMFREGFYFPYTKLKDDKWFLESEDAHKKAKVQDSNVPTPFFLFYFLIVK